MPTAGKRKTPAGKRKKPAGKAARKTVRKTAAHESVRRTGGRAAHRTPVRRKRPRTGTTPGGNPSTVLPATTLGTTDVSIVPPPPDQEPEGGAVADTDGVLTDITGEPAANIMPLESEEPFDPPADSNAGSPGADVENPADDSYTKPEK